MHSFVQLAERVGVMRRIPPHNHKSYKPSFSS